MSHNFDLGLVPGPVSRMRVACTGCGDYSADDNGNMIGDDQGLPALRPNVAIIIIGLGFTLVVVVAFAVFAKFMRPHMNRQNNNASGGSRLWEDVVKDGSQVDAKVIKRLPLVVYSAQSFQGLKLDLECAVCLSQFEEGEELRLLPSCKHMFHPACIDGWLRSHPFCPLCRSNVLSTSWDLHAQPETTQLSNFEVTVSQDSQRGREDHQLQSSSPEPHVEIPVLERFEARFEALRDMCCGRKGKRCSPMPQEGHINELEKCAGSDSLAIFSTSGSISAPKFHKPESCDLPVSAVCISISRDEQDQGFDSCHALQKKEWAPGLGGDRILDEGPSSGGPSSTSSAPESTCQHR